MMLVRIRVLGEYIHGDWHIMRASLRPLCGREIYSDRLREELQVAEIDYARIIGGITVCGACFWMLCRAVENTTQACERIACFTHSECECVGRALDPRK